MRSKKIYCFLILVFVVFIQTALFAQNDTARRIVILDAEALKLLDSNTEIKILAQGFKWTEGPLYINDGDYLLFSDIPNNKIYRWKEGEDTSTYLFPSGFTGTVYKGKEPGSNGLLLSNKHELILMQHGDRRVAKMNAPLSKPSPSFIPLVNNYKGKLLNSPNDGVFAADGSLYFTDPPYGLANNVDDSAKQLPFQGVFILRSNGKPELFTDEIKFPNGIALSNDGKYLFVSNSDPKNRIWLQFELDKNGLKKSSKIFYDATNDKSDGNPDGMKMSKSGYLFAAGPGGVLIFNASGKLIARIYTGALTANCAFGKNEKTLFITCSNYVMSVELK
jgi:gluconolactonase